MARKPLSWTKAAIGAATVGAMMSAAPALARDNYRGHDRDGISAGEVIAGAVILGGLAAILSSGDNDRYDSRYNGRYDGRYDDPRYGYGYDYNRYGNSRSAVDRCVRAVEREGRRYGNLDVTQVTSIDRRRDGYRIKGRVLLRDRYNGGWDRGYGDRYGSGYGYDYDKGRFSCDFRYGRIQDVRLAGLR